MDMTFLMLAALALRSDGKAVISTAASEAMDK
jgi:hypothetical protein